MSSAKIEGQIKALETELSNLRKLYQSRKLEVDNFTQVLAAYQLASVAGKRRRPDGDEEEGSSNVKRRHVNGTAGSVSSKLCRHGTLWSEDLDNRLRQVIAEIGTLNWRAVAECVGHGMTNDQCGKRWRLFLSPEAQARKSQLASWKKSGASSGTMKNPRQRANKNDNQNGEDDDNDTVRFWNEDMDDKLRLAVAKYGTVNWNVVADYVGLGKTNQQCGQRWWKHLCPEAIERKTIKLKRKPFSTWEDELLKAFIMTNKKIDNPKVSADVKWKGVEEVVGRCSGECKRRMFFFKGTPGSGGGFRVTSKALQEVKKANDKVQKKFESAKSVMKSTALAAKKAKAAATAAAEAAAAAAAIAEAAEAAAEAAAAAAGRSGRTPAKKKNTTSAQAAKTASSASSSSSAAAAPKKAATAAAAAKRKVVVEPPSSPSSSSSSSSSSP